MNRPLQAAALGIALWLILTRGEPAGFGFGAVAIVAALTIARAVHGPASPALRWQRLLPFVLFFVSGSLRSGLDVAQRALRRHPDLQPGFVDVPLRVTGEAAQTLVAMAATLMPGSLATHIGPGRLRLHVLDTRAPVTAEIARLEREVALLLGEALPGDDPP